MRATLVQQVQYLIEHVTAMSTMVAVNTRMIARIQAYVLQDRAAIVREIEETMRKEIRLAEALKEPAPADELLERRQRKTPA